LGVFCRHRTATNAPAIVLVQRRNGNQVFRCRFCGREWPLPFQIHKLPRVALPDLYCPMCKKPYTNHPECTACDSPDHDDKNCPLVKDYDENLGTERG
jgi:hypothetical protein